MTHWPPIDPENFRVGGDPLRLGLTSTFGALASALADGRVSILTHGAIGRYDARITWPLGEVDDKDLSRVAI